MAIEIQFSTEDLSTEDFSTVLSTVVNIDEHYSHLDDF